MLEARGSLSVSADVHYLKVVRSFILNLFTNFVPLPYQPGDRIWVQKRVECDMIWV